MRKLLIILSVVILIIGCSENPGPSSKENYVPIDRETKIPDDAVKITPQTDAAPVKSFSSEYDDPVPLPYPVNTAGAEDSAFITPDGNTIFIFFTPDVSIPVQEQVVDKVTGIYITKKVDGQWQTPQRVLLQKPGKAGLDGCEFVRENEIFFCTVREGYTGIHWFKAYLVDGQWQDWEIADSELKVDEYNTGELHISSDGSELYFHADNKEGGKGGRDIWVSKKSDDGWSEPVNLAAVNTERDDGYPALSPDDKELWISRDYGLWRSKKEDGQWQEPELMFSPLAGEASIDNEGNVYFTHHFFEKDMMIEADIYVARRK